MNPPNKTEDEIRANEGIGVKVEIENFEEIASAKTIRLRLPGGMLVSEALIKIASKGSVFIISSNISYGEENYELADKRGPLERGKTLTEIGLTNGSTIFLRKKTQEVVSLSINIEDYIRLKSAMQVSFVFPRQQTVHEALKKIARKPNVNIPLTEEEDYGFYFEGNFLDLNRTLAFFGLKNKDVVKLVHLKKDREITLKILIEDYQELVSARQTSHMFPLTTTVDEVIQKICKRASVGIDPIDVQIFELFLPESHSPVARGKTIQELEMKNRDTLILRKLGESKRASMEVVSIASAEVVFIGKIGVGTFGKVFRAVYTGRPVAVKVLKEGPDEKSMREFKHEVTLLKTYNCPQIVKLFGVIEEVNKWAIVMEICDRGSLYHTLNSGVYVIGWDRTFQFAIDSVKGVLYLHNQKPPCLHRDIKSLNLLVTEDFTIKLCDFGLSRHNTAEYLETLRRMRSTPAWSAPELLQQASYTVKSDVYGLGIVLWELIFRCIKGYYQRPFAEYPQIMHDFQILVQAHSRQLRPTMPASCPTSVMELYIRCVDADPDKRPDCQEILDILIRLKSDYFKNPTSWEKIRDHDKSEFRD